MSPNFGLNSIQQRADISNEERNLRYALERIKQADKLYSDRKWASANRTYIGAVRVLEGMPRTFRQYVKHCLLRQAISYLRMLELASALNCIWRILFKQASGFGEIPEHQAIMDVIWRIRKRSSYGSYDDYRPSGFSGHI